MCGILAFLRPVAVSKYPSPSYLDNVYPRLRKETAARGPDALSSPIDPAPDPDCRQTTPPLTGVPPDPEYPCGGASSLRVFSSVLSLRPPLTPQPIVVPDQSGRPQLVVQFNGELYNDDISGNDTAYFASAVAQALLHPDRPSDSDGGKAARARQMRKVVQQLRGEYAFVVTDCVHGECWFARDPIGRRSLVKIQSCGADAKKEEGDSGVIFCSVAAVSISGNKEDLGIDETRIRVEEVPAGVLSCLETDSHQLSSYNWTYADSTQGPQEAATLAYPYTRVNQALLPAAPTAEEEAARLTQQLDELLEQATRRRVADIPYIVHRPSSLDELDSCGASSPSSSASALPPLPAQRPRVAVLFSGGLDCSLVAQYVARIVAETHPNEPIDLLNVAFENPRVAAAHSATQKAPKKKNKPGAQDVHPASFDIYDTPDRVLARKSWKALASKYPALRLVEINVPYSATLTHRARVQRLMYPQATAMDLSIAIAFYFAARGHGTLYRAPAAPPVPAYTTSASVLFSGLGADELFGGYMRHARVLEEGDGRPARDRYRQLAGELQLDFSRLDSRNLGRDDRVCSAWAREVRYVFLDEAVVRWATARCPLDLKVGRPREGAKEPETKVVLRRVARLMGEAMAASAEEKKRAVQFGSRSAKMEVGSGRSKGTDAL